MTKIAIAARYADDSPYGRAQVTIRLVDGTAGASLPGGLSVDRTFVECDVETGEAIVDLTPNEDITDPPGTYYALTVERTSPTVVRYIEVPQPNGSGDAEIPYSWDDETIQRLNPVPPTSIPAAASGDAGDVLTVTDDGNGKKYELRAPTGGGGGTPTEVRLVLSADAVDGSGDVFTALVSSPEAAGGGAIPPEFKVAPGTPEDMSASTLSGLVTSFFGGPITALVWADDLWSVRTVSPSAIDEPWPEITASQVVFTTVQRWYADLVDGVLTVRDASTVPLGPTGILTGANDVQAFGLAVEGALEGRRFVRGYFLDPVTDLATLMADPVDDVDQPITDDGQQVVKGDLVATLGDVDGDGQGWIKVVDIDTGQWGDLPSTGPTDPVEAAGWDNALTTNYLRGGDEIVTATGAIGTFCPNRTNGVDTWPRGGPSVILEPYAPGFWVFTAPGGASGVSLGETSGTAYRGDRGKTAYDHSQATTGNPHSVTKSEVGLGNVTNDAQIAKSLVTTKGDLIVATASDTPARLGVGAAGTIPVSNSNETTGFGWVGTSAPIVFESGLMSACAPYVSSASALTSGRITYYRFRVPRRITFDRFGVNHISGVSTTGGIFVGIYSPTATGGGPGARLVDVTSGGTINPTTTAAVKLITGTWALDPGDYWYGILGVFSGTAPTLAFATTIGSFVFPEAAGAGNVAPFQSGLSALPSNASGYTSGVSSAPVMYARPS